MSARTTSSGWGGLIAALALAVLFLCLEMGRLYLASGIKIRVEGNLSAQEREQLGAVLRPWLQTQVFTLDTEELAREVGSLPWVGAIEVRPIGIKRISVKLSHSLSNKLTKSERTLINTLGGLVAGSDVPVTIARDQIDLQLLGDNASAREFVFLTFDVMLEGLELELESVEISPSGHVQLEIDADKTLVLGASEPYARLHRFARIYRAALQDDWARAEQVDTRYHDGVSVRWRHAGFAAEGGAPLPTGLSTP